MFRDIFQAIADPTRRRIIELLSHQTMHLTAIAGHFPISRPAVSKHIRILSECGVISIRQQGRERYCQTNMDSLHVVTDWVNRCKDQHASRPGSVDALLEQMQQRYADTQSDDDETST